jgi:hypothetical protein
MGRYTVLWPLLHTPPFQIFQVRGGRRGVLDLFAFPRYNCCPVLALRNLWDKQSSVHQTVPALPVFCFPSSTNLTNAWFNKILADLLSDMCTLGINSISATPFGQVSLALSASSLT